MIFYGFLMFFLTRRHRFLTDMAAHSVVRSRLSYILMDR